jgi:hypothetical protein
VPRDGSLGRGTSRTDMMMTSPTSTNSRRLMRPSPSLSTARKNRSTEKARVWGRTNNRSCSQVRFKTTGSGSMAWSTARSRNAASRFIACWRIM